MGDTKRSFSAATGAHYMQWGITLSGLRWVRSHSSRRSPVAFAPYAPPAGSLVVVVALWHRSGASRRVSGQWPAASYVVCAPPAPMASPLRGIGPALAARPPPRGSLSPALGVMNRAGLCSCYQMHSSLRIFCGGYRPKWPVSQRAAGLLRWVCIPNPLAHLA